VEDCQARTLSKEEIQIDYRQTPFTGLHAKLITEVVFHFPPLPDSRGMAKDRIAWSKEHQDHSGPNCGSVFKSCDYRLMGRLAGLRFGQAKFSRKTPNWIINQSANPRGIRLLIGAAQILHRLRRKKAVLELIKVD
jgi:UDP-N-acetylmuramate dehydrogenase